MGQEFKQKSLGEKRIRIDLEESQVGLVGTLKYKIACMINSIDEVEQKSGEHGRLKAVAITELENASMWITKALTYELD